MNIKKTIYRDKNDIKQQKRYFNKFIKNRFGKLLKKDFSHQEIIELFKIKDINTNNYFEFEKEIGDIWKKQIFWRE